MNRRQTEGSETWRRLLDWDRNQKASERLAAQLLRMEGFLSIDPSHPLGGPDGLKDIICSRNNKKWIAAVYFPRGTKNFKEVREKYEKDIKGLETNNAEGIAFFSNQEITLGERDELKEIVLPKEAEIYHLERISSLLDSPACYGIRLEYLDIEMTKDEQLAYIVVRDQMFANQEVKIDEILKCVKEIPQEEQNKIKRPKTEYVIPNQSSLLSLLMERHHRCSYCKYGFKIRLLPMTFGSTNFVTCPNCGNIDYFSPDR